jgi:hypothetical protein
LEIVASDYRPNATGDGMVLRLDCVSAEGIRHMIALPLENDDAGAQQAGQKAFAAIRSAIGVPQPKDTVELHGIAFEVQTGVRGTRFRPVRR